MSDPLQVYIAHEPMIEAFHDWVALMGWHLEGPGPLTFSEDDTPTHFLLPLPSSEALGEYLRGGR